MSEERNDGGPAFPGGSLPEHPHVPNGMSLRDYFAGQALSSVGSFWSDEETRAEYAKRSYLMADAMLAARQKP